MLISVVLTGSGGANNLVIIIILLRRCQDEMCSSLVRVSLAAAILK